MPNIASVKSFIQTLQATITHTPDLFGKGRDFAWGWGSDKAGPRQEFLQKLKQHIKEIETACAKAVESKDEKTDSDYLPDDLEMCLKNLLRDFLNRYNELYSKKISENIKPYISKIIELVLGFMPLELNANNKGHYNINQFMLALARKLNKLKGEAQRKKEKELLEQLQTEAKALCHKIQTCQQGLEKIVDATQQEQKKLSEELEQVKIQLKKCQAEVHELNHPTNAEITTLKELEEQTDQQKKDALCALGYRGEKPISTTVQPTAKPDFAKAKTITQKMVATAKQLDIAVAELEKTALDEKQPDYTVQMRAIEEIYELILEIVFNRVNKIRQEIIATRDNAAILVLAAAVCKKSHGLYLRQQALQQQRDALQAWLKPFYDFSQSTREITNLDTFSECSKVQQHIAKMKEYLKTTFSKQIHAIYKVFSPQQRTQLISLLKQHQLLPPFLLTKADTMAQIMPLASLYRLGQTNSTLGLKINKIIEDFLDNLEQNADDRAALKNLKQLQQACEEGKLETILVVAPNTHPQLQQLLNMPGLFISQLKKAFSTLAQLKKFFNPLKAALLALKQGQPNKTLNSLLQEEVAKQNRTIATMIDPSLKTSAVQTSAEEEDNESKAAAIHIAAAMKYRTNLFGCGNSDEKDNTIFFNPFDANSLAQLENKQHEAKIAHHYTQAVTDFMLEGILLDVNLGQSTSLQEDGTRVTMLEETVVANRFERTYTTVDMVCRKLLQANPYIGHTTLYQPFTPETENQRRRNIALVAINCGFAKAWENNFAQNYMSVSSTLHACGQFDILPKEVSNLATFIEQILARDEVCDLLAHIFPDESDQLEQQGIKGYTQQLLRQKAVEILPLVQAIENNSSSAPRYTP